MIGLVHCIIICAIILEVYLCLKSLPSAVAFFIVVKCVIPSSTRFVNFSVFTCLLLILLLFTFFQYKECNLQRKNLKDVFSPFFSLILPLAILGLFGTVNYYNQLKWLSQWMVTEFVPFMLFLVIVRNKDDLKKCVDSLVIAFTCIGVWGILTYIFRLNYYVMLFSMASGYEGSLFLGSGEDSIRGGFTSFSSGNQAEGAIPWGQISLVMSCFGLFYKGLEKGVKRNLFILLSVLNAFLCTKRSIILPLLMVVSYVCVKKGMKINNVVIGVFLLFFSIVSYVSIPKFSNVVDSYIAPSVFFWNDNVAQKNEVKGSSKELRFQQIEYTHRLIDGHFLTGKGLSFSKQYLEKNGPYTLVACFESLFLWSLVNSGYLGFFFISLFFAKLMKKTQGATKSKFDNFAFHGAYFLSIMLTNIYCSLSYFLIVSAMMVKYRQLNGESRYELQN